MNNRFISLLSLGICLSGVNAQTMLVSDSFTDFDRIGGFDGSSTSSTDPLISVPSATNTQWVVNGTSSMVASSSGLYWTMNNTSNRMAIGYFPGFTVGSDQVTVTLDFTTGDLGVAANNLRMALFDASPSGLRETDGFSSSDDSYVDDVGYGILSSGSDVGGPSTIDLALTLRKRENTTSNNLLGTSGDWGSSLAVSAGTGYLDANTDYSLTVTMMENSGTLSITVDITGGNLAGMSFTGVDADNPILNFNAIAMRWGQGANQFSGFNLTNFSVVQVPEPAAYISIVGLLGLILALWRRRK